MVILVLCARFGLCALLFTPSCLDVRIWAPYDSAYFMDGWSFLTLSSPPTSQHSVTVYILTRTMHHLQSQRQAQVHNADGGVGKGVPILSSSPSNESLQTCCDEHGISNDKDTEKCVTELPGKYAKYAGDPPDGGLKAWSVILG